MENFNLMSFDERIIEILTVLKSKKNRYGNILKILKKCSFEYTESDIKEFLSHLKKEKSDLVEVLDFISADIKDTELELTLKGVDFLNNLSEVKINAEIKKREAIEQEEFHRTSTARNIDQMLYFYVMIAIGLLTLLAQIF